MKRLARSCYTKGGYVFARKAADSTLGAEKRVARLASNENPEGPSPLAIAAGKEALVTANRYPDETVENLTSALRSYYGDYTFVAGVGMDGVIETLIRTLVDPGETVGVSTPTFSFYRLAAEAQGARVVPVPRREDFSVDVDALVKSGKDAKIVFLCSPNNPTGNATPIDDVKKVLEGIDGILFLDNAYGEFSSIDYLSLMKKYENIIIGRTFSKVHSLAGLRIGYAFVPAWLQPYYMRAGTPFTVNSVSAAAASAALADPDHATRYVAQVEKWRKRFISGLKYRTLPSDANFVMVDVAPHTGDEIVEKLARCGVLVRSCRSFTGLSDHYIRVSVGEDWENEKFIRELNAV